MFQKAIKGQAFADFLADHHVPDSLKLYKDLLDEVAKACMTQLEEKTNHVWRLYFDDASRAGSRGKVVVRVGLVLVFPRHYVIPRGYSLTETCSNNVAEYNALLLGMQLTEETCVRRLEAYGDSQLIVNQVRGKYEVRSEDLMPYHFTVIKMAQKFEEFYIGHLSRLQNVYTDVLSSLAAAFALPSKTWIFDS